MSTRLLSTAALAVTMAACSTPARQYNQPLGIPPLAARDSAPAFHDYLQFGYDLARRGYDPIEASIDAANAGNLHKIWKRDLGAPLDAQPVLATNVPVRGRARTLLYIGTEGGTFYALDAASGAIVWSRHWDPVRTSCQDLPGGVFGITGTAAIDRARNLVYVPTPQGSIAALDLATGVEARGWPVALFSTVRQDHIYSAVTYNPSNGMLYAETAGYCDKVPWHGRIAAIDTARRAVVSALYPGGKHGGGGIWGMGGVAVDARSNRVYAVTGNTAGKNQSARYGEHALRLSPQLDVLGANFPNVFGPDVDFGATPMLFQTRACPPRMVAKNKSGVLLMWTPAQLENGPVQTLQMAHDTEAGEFIGVTAYSPKTQLVYVGNPHGVGFFKTGIDALGVDPRCHLYVRWEQKIGEAAADNDNVAPAVANGVVYAAGGLTAKVWAFDAQSGAALWNSGPAIGGPTFTPPVIDGLLFVPSWDRSLYAFGT